MERPKVGIATIILNKKKVLLGKRRGSHGEGTWCFPGGHLEYFEKLKECAERETKEETGLKIKVIDEDSTIATNDFFRDENKHYITLFVRAKYLGGNPKIMEPEKCEEWKWFYWDDLPEKLFLPIQNLKKQNYDPFK